MHRRMGNFYTALWDRYIYTYIYVYIYMYIYTHKYTKYIYIYTHKVYIHYNKL